jgi:glutaredoxin
MGIGQMRPNTAFDLEQSKLVYVPQSSDGTPNIEPQVFDAPSEWFTCPHCKRVSRLLNPVWAIEYVAANMEHARTKKHYWGPPDPDPRNRLSHEWERMASYHNTGVVNINEVAVTDRDNFWQNIIEPYLVGILATGIKGQNLLW